MSNADTTLAHNRRAELCRGCGKVFAETHAGDAHRVGEHGVHTGPGRRRCMTTEEMQAKIIQSGKRKGEPWFATKVDRYGTEIWRRNVPDTRWLTSRVDQNGGNGTTLVGLPGEGSPTPFMSTPEGA